MDGLAGSHQTPAWTASDARLGWRPAGAGMFRPRNDSRWGRGHGWETKMTTGRLVIVSAVLAVLAAGVAAAPAPDGVAVVIGNRTYANDRVPEVAYAHRDADAFRQYVVGMLGFDPDNIIDLRDATQAEMETTFGNERDHKGRLWSYLDPSGGSDVVVYYSGSRRAGTARQEGLPAALRRQSRTPRS